jgi:hypothetical protein
MLGRHPGDGAGPVPMPVRQLAARVMTREREASTGRRPPAHSLLQRLSLLADFEATLAQYPSRADFARSHGVRPDYLRDLIRWACTDAAGAQLFVLTSSACAPGHLTPVARYLLTCLHPTARRAGDHHPF